MKIDWTSKSVDDAIAWMTQTYNAPNQGDVVQRMTDNGVTLSMLHDMRLETLVQLLDNKFAVDHIHAKIHADDAAAARCAPDDDGDILMDEAVLETNCIRLEDLRLQPIKVLERGSDYLCEELGRTAKFRFFLDAVRDMEWDDSPIVKKYLKDAVLKNGGVRFEPVYADPPRSPSKSKSGCSSTGHTLDTLSHFEALLVNNHLSPPSGPGSFSFEGIWNGCTRKEDVYPPLQQKLDKAETFFRDGTKFEAEDWEYLAVKWKFQFEIGSTRISDFIVKVKSGIILGIEVKPCRDILRMQAKKRRENEKSRRATKRVREVRESADAPPAKRIRSTQSDEPAKFFLDGFQITFRGRGFKSVKDQLEAKLQQQDYQIKTGLGVDAVLTTSIDKKVLTPSTLKNIQTAKVPIVDVKWLEESLKKNEFVDQAQYVLWKPQDMVQDMPQDMAQEEKKEREWCSLEELFKKRAIGFPRADGYTPSACPNEAIRDWKTWSQAVHQLLMMLVQYKAHPPVVLLSSFETNELSLVFWVADSGDKIGVHIGVLDAVNLMTFIETYKDTSWYGDGASPMAFTEIISSLQWCCEPCIRQFFHDVQDRRWNWWLRRTLWREMRENRSCPSEFLSDSSSNIL